MGRFWVLVVLVVWFVIALIVGCYQFREGDSRREKVTTLALAVVMWPVMLLAVGLDPQQLHDAVDDDHP